MPIGSLIAILAGLALLLWSADRFISGAATLARQWGMSPLLIGMLIVGFGTSSPELLVSATAALQGTPAIAVGNAYGSNIANIALILGVTAIISPIAVKSRTLQRELPILTGVTAIAAIQLLDATISRAEAFTLLGLFVVLAVWSVLASRKSADDSLGAEIESELNKKNMSQRQAWLRLILGLIMLLVSANLLVSGAVDIARFFGISDLVIGLTVIAIGTSLPELASAVLAARRDEHEIALGAVIGSNLFNTLSVVGIAGVVQPIALEPAVLTRDMLVVGVLTLSLFVLGRGFRGRPGRINRIEGGVLFVVWIGYTTMLLMLKTPVTP